MNCREISPPLTLLEYKLISKIGEGTFSEVIKAQNIKTGKLVAIKCMKEKISIDKVRFLNATAHTDRSKS